MSVLVLDAGNSIIKAKIARRDKGEISPDEKVYKRITNPFN